MVKIINETLFGEIERLMRCFADIEPNQPGFSLSIKKSWRNGFGQEEQILLLGQVAPFEGRLPSPQDWCIMRLEALHGLIGLKRLDPAELPELLSNARATYSSPLPPASVLLHAAMAPLQVCFAQPPALLAAFCLTNSQIRLGEWFQHAAILPFTPDLQQQAQAVAQSAGKALVLHNRGILVGADNPADCRQMLETMIQNARLRLPLVETLAGGQAGLAQVDELPRLRAEICAQRGRPLVLELDDTPGMCAFMEMKACAEMMQHGAPTPDLAKWTSARLLVQPESDRLPALPEESRSGATIVLKPGLGAVIAANSPLEAQQAGRAWRTSVQAMAMAVQAGGCQPPDAAALRAATAWESVLPVERLAFSGEVALVTGSAVGIGKAIVAALLRRGCAVAGLDISPSIETTFDHPAYLGLCCDVSDEARVRAVIQAVKRRFGGLDILALNAGLFPGGCNIEKMNLEEFNRVLNVNFVSNLVIMREAFPLLKLAPRYGRVVIIGSKNMRAPGPGAAAYSTSKAALTQLARVAALEWGSERVRVNVIHPDSVFDTALYTEEVLKARAAHYGMTVEQYKKRNLLKTEITSYDVAELAAEMCGPLFRHMTGGQIQLDGGNDRTI